MSRKITTIWGLMTLLFIGSVALICIVTQSSLVIDQVNNFQTFVRTYRVGGAAGTMIRFASADDFKQYLESSSQTGYPMMFGSPRFGEAGSRSMMGEDLALPSAEAGLGTMPKDETDRYSQTNVQVAGIDEPDIVKNDEQRIYFSTSPYYYWRQPEVMPIFEESFDIAPPRQPENRGILSFKAFPPENLTKDSLNSLTGNLLLKDNTLVVLPEQYNVGSKIVAYDVSQPAQATEKWDLTLDERVTLAAARLFQDKIYLITSSNIDYGRPCPLAPLKIGSEPLSIACSDIYHPSFDLAVDVTYNIVTLDIFSGKIIDSLSLVGSSADSIIYVSAQAIYVSYFHQGDFIKYFTNFVKLNSDLFPAWLVDKLNRLQTYDLSASAKMAEFSVLLEKFYSDLSSDERLRIENELNNRMEAYAKEHQRELELTSIVKVNLNGLAILAQGTVPGRALNQFSLDEYQNHLRIAATIGNNWWGWGWGFGSSESFNDVYILDDQLRITGSITDLGLTERIYSARFMGDRGYLVTFRQIDPFYVLDLTDPANPKKAGELKIPGYSSYLHPLKENRILGVGEESGQVKLSLFDVSNPQNPTEVSKYELNEYWTEVNSNHHAFLQDAKHKIFFLPGGQGGYIFSYDNDQLSLTKAISETNVKRAVYINDYLYLVGENKLTVLNEQTWEKVNELSY